MLLAQGAVLAVATQGELIGFTLGSVLVIILIILVIGVPLYRFLRRDVEEDDELDEPVTDEDLLAQFQAAREAGDMEEEEYQRVSAVIQQRMRTGTVPAVKPAAGAGGSGPQAAPSPMPAGEDHPSQGSLGPP
ncbi:MAG TPA: hypothetical protein VGZ22_19165 [Isosphaeraceae bacterium]|jgi:uncharacterized membrane protein|nr:hypothetical protein [Isosphaeraceae bacterium]